MVLITSKEYLFIELNTDQFTHTFEEEYMPSRRISPRKILEAVKIEAGIVHRQDAYISEPEKVLMKIYAESYV